MIIDNQPKPNNDIQCDQIEYVTPCAGLNCKNVHTEYFDISLKIKSAWLCPSCKKTLEEDGFVFYSAEVNREAGKVEFVIVPINEKSTVEQNAR